MGATYWLLSPNVVFACGGSQRVCFLLGTQCVSYPYWEHTVCSPCSNTHWVPYFSTDFVAHTQSTQSTHTQLSWQWLKWDWSVCQSLVNLNVAKVRSRFSSSVRDSSSEKLILHYISGFTQVPIATSLGQWSHEKFSQVHVQSQAGTILLFVRIHFVKCSH